MPDAAFSPRGRPRRFLAAHWLILLGLTLPAAMLGLSMLMAWQGLWTQTENRGSEAAEAAAEYAYRILTTQILATDRISESVRGVTEAEIRSDEAHWHRHLQGQIARLRLALDAKLLGADGHVLAAASASPPPAASMASREHFTALESIPEGAAWISRVYERASDGKRFFAVSRARHLPDAGAVMIALDQQAFGAGLARVAIGDGEAIALLRRDGEVLVRYPAVPSPVTRLPPNAPIMRVMAEGQALGAFQANLPANGERALISFHRLPEHPSLYAVSIIPRSLVLRHWWREIWHVLAFGVLAMLGLGALALRVARQQASLLAAKAELEARVAERSAALADEGQRLALALEANDVGFWEMDLAHRKIWRSRRMRELLGLPEDAVVSDYPGNHFHVHPDDAPLLNEKFDQVLRGETRNFQIELRLAMRSGEWRWMESFGRVVRRDARSGVPRLFSGITRDITERKAGEARRDMMIHELDHRAKNILAVIQSILRLSKKEDPARYAVRVEGRIAALSRAQAMLSAEGWSGADLANLLRGELAAFAAPGIEPARFTLQGPAFRLSAAFVQPLTLAMHELASNAQDHGALTMPEGEIALGWQIDDQAGLVRMQWVETGGPVALPPARWGVGGTLIRTTIEKQLNGSFTPEWQESGFSARITLPLGKALGQQPAG